MPTLSDDTTPQNEHQKQLVALMTPVVQEYYSRTNPTEEEIELALITNIEELQQFMETVLVGTTNRQKDLTANQKKLVTLMTPIVQKYYNSTNPSQKETELALTTNMQGLQKLMGAMLASITNQQNIKISKAIEEADKAPYSAY